MTWFFDHWISILAVLTSLVYGWVLYRVMNTRKETRNNLVPPEVREHSHNVANEATIVRAVVKRISNTPDPIKSLIDVMSKSGKQ